MLTEHRLTPSQRASDGIQIGTTSMRREGERLIVDVDERTALFGRRVRGRITLHTETRTDALFPLDAAGQHVWSPLAPSGRIEVDLRLPSLRFSGRGYHDANAGAVGLERSLSSWTWCRGHDARGDTLITYARREVDGSTPVLPLRIDRAGGISSFAGSVEPRDLGRSLWGLRRSVHADPRARTKRVKNLEDTPFYARDVVRTQLDGSPVTAVHETFSVERLVSPWVEFMIPYRTRCEG